LVDDDAHPQLPQLLDSKDQPFKADDVEICYLLFVIYLQYPLHFESLLRMIWFSFLGTADRMNIFSASRAETVFVHEAGLGLVVLYLLFL
jgi:hypothetical protein